MALFLINRYLGDEGDDGSSNESRAKALLAKLQRKAKVKEQQSLSCQEEYQSKTTVESDRVTSVKKKRKNKGGNLDVTKHPKKRKEQVNQDVSPPDPEELSEGDNARKKKDTKKMQLTEKDKDGMKQKSVHNKNGNLQEAAAADKTELLKNDEMVEKIQTDQSIQDTETNPSQTGFTILGGFEKKIIQKVQRVLPKWLAEPDVIQRDITSNLVPISDVPGICTKLQRKLESNGIHHLFPVQAEVIPAILESVSHGLLIGRGGYKPRNICVSAPTGSGKTGIRYTCYSGTDGASCM